MEVKVLSSNVTKLSCVKEDVPGVVPLDPVFKELRKIKESLGYNPSYEKSPELRADRMTSDVNKMGYEASGSIETTLSYGSHDDQIEAVLAGNWTATGSAVTDATDISITKTAGTPNTWLLSSTVTDFTALSWVVGQHVKVSGFTGYGTFIFEVISAPSVNEVSIAPLIDVDTIAAGDTVTLQPLEFLRNGVVDHSFTLQREHLDADSTFLFNFPGTRFGSWALKIAVDSILTSEFSVLCLDAVATGTQYAGATFLPTSTTQEFNASNHVQPVIFNNDPASSTYYLTGFDINFSNNLRNPRAVGRQPALAIRKGEIDMTGTMELYVQNLEIFQNFIDDRLLKVTISLQDGSGNGYIIVIPSFKFTSMPIAIEKDKDVMASADFIAKRNEENTYQYQITRYPAE